jgi:16S rRNA processing protein RimM
VTATDRIVADAVTVADAAIDVATDLALTHLVMGKVGAPWGVKGWVKLLSYTDPPGNLLDYRHFVLTGARGAGQAGQGQGQIAIEIDELRPQGQTLVGHIKGCDTREQCGLYTGGELWVAKSALPTLAAGEGYYWHQLEQLTVITQDGVVLGKVQHLLATGANDVVVVRDAQGKERLLPYVPQVVRKVDLDSGVMAVDWQMEWDD